MVTSPVDCAAAGVVRLFPLPIRLVNANNNIVSSPTAVFFDEEDFNLRPHTSTYVCHVGRSAKHSSELNFFFET